METKYNEIMQLLSMMRKAQKEYFRTHSKIILKWSKDLEKQIDDEIAQWEREQNAKSEPTLNL